jgi:hypothetical protein
LFWITVPSIRIVGVRCRHVHVAAAQPPMRSPASAIVDPAETMDFRVRRQPFRTRAVPRGRRPRSRLSAELN